MTRAVCCVATTTQYQKGQIRLRAVVEQQNEAAADPGNPIEEFYWQAEPDGSPRHVDVPYAFKAYALKEAARFCDLLLWCDASILPIRSLEPLWERIERKGHWIARNGWNNYQWTADSAYLDLFPDEINQATILGKSEMDWTRNINKQIPHVVATSFGLNVKHPIGKEFLAEYYRLASETKAFCGPWINSNNPRHTGSSRAAPCGPPDVLGHRHDQTAASVIAWRLGMKLTDCPEIFAYSKRRQDGTLHLEDQDERTILLADGRMDSGLHA